MKALALKFWLMSACAVVVTLLLLPVAVSSTPASGEEAAPSRSGASGVARGMVTHHGEGPRGTEQLAQFPRSIDSYGDEHLESLWEILVHRVQVEPFNLWATLFFFGAIIHTFLCHRFRHIAHVMEERYRERITHDDVDDRLQDPVCAPAKVFHFLGEVEAVFGIWVLPLIVLMNFVVGPSAADDYINFRVNFTEPVFVVVIMAIASTRPVLQLAEGVLRRLARFGGETPTAWWLVLLTIGPLLGSFITEPAAMTICASLLSKKFYSLSPPRKLGYATIGFLFVAISVGGTLTHFAAPPVLMVAHAWHWDLPFMLQHFGWKAAFGIAISAASYFFLFRGELSKLDAAARNVPEGPKPRRIPSWVTVGHLLFMAYAVWHSHDQSYLMITMLFFLAFVEVTGEYQQPGGVALRPAVLVGFFLAGLVIHGGLQQWWIAPVLGRLEALPLMFTAMALTAFNDNAAITYLCTLVPTFTDGLKYAAVAGAVTGGGLTVIANAPNPAGQAILNKHFEDGVSALWLFVAALLPTAILTACFLFL